MVSSCTLFFAFPATDVISYPTAPHHAVERDSLPGSTPPGKDKDSSKMLNARNEGSKQQTNSVFIVAHGYFSGHAASEVSFMVFNSVWSLLVLAYLVLAPKFFPRLYHILVVLGLAVVTTIFWFAGSIAAAVYLGTPRGCSSNSWCGAFQAFVAFGFFIWAGFTGLSVLFGLDFKRNRSGSAGITTHKPATQPYPSV